MKTLADVQKKNILRRWIPLPRHFSMESEVLLPAGEIGICHHGLRGAPADYAVKMLTGRLAQLSGKKAAADPAPAQNVAFTISLAVDPDEPDLARRSPQSYLIRSTKQGIELIGASAIGLIYAVATLIPVIQKDKQSSALCVPLLEVLDYPQFEERGFWYWPPDLSLGEYGRLLDWMYERKLNYWDMMVVDNGLKYPSRKYPDLVREDRFSRENHLKSVIQMGKDRGINIVAGIVHLEQHPKIVGRYPDLAGPRGKSAVAGALAPLCFSVDCARDFFADIFGEMAEICGVREIMAWLNEDVQVCGCERCKQENEFVLQAKGIVAAWQMARRSYPDLKLRSLLSQGSRFAGNDEVMAVIPREVKISYYNGNDFMSRPDEPSSYSTKPIPIISSAVERYIAQGFAMGLCALHHTYFWRSNMGLCELTRLRCIEAAEKGITWLNGFPANPAHVLDEKHMIFTMDKNALAEYGWNPWGRSLEQGFSAWCEREGYRDPETAAQAFCVLDRAIAGLVNLSSDLVVRSVLDLALTRPLMDQITYVVFLKGQAEGAVCRAVEADCCKVKEMASAQGWCCLAAAADMVRGIAVICRLVYLLWRLRENEGWLMTVKETTMIYSERLKLVRKDIRAVLEELEEANAVIAEAGKILGEQPLMQMVASIWQKIIPEYEIQARFVVASRERIINVDERLK